MSQVMRADLIILFLTIQMVENLGIMLHRRHDRMIKRLGWGRDSFWDVKRRDNDALMMLELTLEHVIQFVFIIVVWRYKACLSISDCGLRIGPLKINCLTTWCYWCHIQKMLRKWWSQLSSEQTMDLGRIQLTYWITIIVIVQHFFRHRWTILSLDR